MKNLAEQLSRVLPFSVLSKKEIEMLAEDALLVELNGGEVLFQPGSPSDGIYFVISGGIKLIQHHPEHKRLILEFCGPKDIIIEEGHFKNTAHSFEARPIGSAQVVKISHRVLKKLFDTNPRFVNAWLELVSQKLGWYQKRLEELVFQDVEERLAQALIVLAKKFGKRENKGILISVKVTHQDLSDYIAASRETVSLTLGKFRRKRLVQTKVRWLIIPDIRALRKVEEV